MRDELETMCKDLDISDKVIFTGTRDDIDVILNSMDVFVFPSTFEGLGLVLLEAQAAKVPCLVSEAIQPEVDLGVGLVKKLNLSCGASKWVDEANKIINENKNNDIDIIKAVQEKKYDLNSILNNLLSVYKLKLD